MPPDQVGFDPFCLRDCSGNDSLQSGAHHIGRRRAIELLRYPPLRVNDIQSRVAA